MNTRAEHHLEYLKAKAARLMDTKYRAGQKEHGGVLLDMESAALLNNAIDEAIDQVVYLLTLREKLLEEKNGQQIVRSAEASAR